MNQKLKKLQILTICVTFAEVIALVILLISFLISNNTIEKAYIFYYVTLILFLLFSLGHLLTYIFVTGKMLKEKRVNDIKGASVIGSELNEAYNYGEIGLLVTDENDTVIWVSEYLEQHNINIMDTKIEDFNFELSKLKDVTDEDYTIKINHENRTYQVKYIRQAHLYIFKDISSEESVRNYNAEHEPVVGFIALDNYQDVQQNLDEGAFMDLLSSTRKLIINFFQSDNTLLRQIRNDYFLFITTRKTYDEYAQNQFSILDQVRKLNTKEGFTVSIGIGYGLPEHSKLAELASNAVDVCLSRGGDQVVIAPFSAPMIFFGGKTEARISHNKVRLRVKADSLLTIMKHASNIIVMGHKNADFDALGACFAILSMAKSLNKEAKIFTDLANFETKVRVAFRSKYITEKERNDISLNAKNVHSFYNPDTLVVIVDCNGPSMCLYPNFITDDTKIAIVDHHRPGKDSFKNVLFTGSDTSASSTCEILTSYITQASTKIDVSAVYATFMLTGIILDTNRYRNRTSNLTYDACAALKNFGADNEVSDMFLQENYPEFQLKTKLLSKFDSPFTGILLCVASDEKDPLDPSIIAKVASEGMEISGVQATFVIGRTDKDMRISCRSDGTINCQLLMEKLGGGGHYRMAACSLQTDNFDEAKKKLISVLEDHLAEAKLTDNKEYDLDNHDLMKY